jgi:hypothetical protein
MEVLARRPAVDEQVLRLEVAVDDALVDVQVLESIYEVAREAPRVRFEQLALLRVKEPLVQPARVTPRHCYEPGGQQQRRSSDAAATQMRCQLADAYDDLTREASGGKQ